MAGSNGLEGNIIRNKVGIKHSGAGGPIGWSSDGILPSDPDWVAAGLFPPQVKGKLAAEPLVSEGPTWGYRQYDQSASWNKATASVMQREIIYYRGPTDSEYLTFYDRVHVSDPNNRPYWHAQVAAKPEVVDEHTLRVTNQHGGQPPFGVNWSLAPTDGRVFIQVVLPANAKMEAVGDDGSFRKMYQDGTGTGTPLTGNYAGCTAQHYELFGWGRVQTTPETVVVGDAGNNFMHILRVGLASTLQAMAPTERLPIFGQDSHWDVAWVGDPWRNRVMGFAQTEEAGLNTHVLRYAFHPTTRTTSHVVVNLVPETPYYVYWTTTTTVRVDVSRFPNGGQRLETDDAGVLAFETTMRQETTE